MKYKENFSYNQSAKALIVIFVSCYILLQNEKEENGKHFLDSEILAKL